MTHLLATVLALAIGIVTIGPDRAAAQQAEQLPPPAEQNDTATAVAYKPPLRGAPGGRVGGASRSASVPAAAVPVLEALAPAEHAGVTADPSPVLYFYVSGAARWPMQFTISEPLRAAPVVETTIPSPTGRGIYAVRTSDLGVNLRPGTVYTWSVAIVVDPRAWSRNAVASATLVFDPTTAAARAASADRQRVAYLARSGLWYDAVADAVALSARNDPAPLQSLLHQVGLNTAEGTVARR